MIHLPPSIPKKRRKRLHHLLNNPHEGELEFKYNPQLAYVKRVFHPLAKYSSNCHGTIAFLCGVGEYPSGLLWKEILPLLKQSSGLQIDSVVAFYSDENLLQTIHSGLIVGENHQIFHQRDTGGIFELSTLEEEIERLEEINKCDIHTQSYEIR